MLSAIDRYGRTGRQAALMASLSLLIMLSACGKGYKSDDIVHQAMRGFSLDRSGTAFSYDVEGVVDESLYLWPSRPPAERFVSSVTIRNVGDSVVADPRIAINGFHLPLNTRELLRSLIQDSPDPLDQVLRIFHAIDRNSVHEDMRYGQWQDSPLTFFVGFGGGMCEDRANIQRMLWEALGYKSGNSQAHGHTAYNVGYGKGIFHLDTDIGSYYLLHDNWTGASSRDIFEDPMLVQRAAHYRDYGKYPIRAGDPEPNMWFSSEKVASLYGDPNREPLFLRPPVNEQFTITLRPGEAYGWNSGRPKHPHPMFKDADLLNVLRDVTWEASLDFTKASHLWPFQRLGEAGASVHESAVIDRNSRIVLSYGYPFPVTAAELTLFPRLGFSAGDLVRVSFKIGKEEPAHLEVPLEELASGRFSLTPHIQKLDYLVHDLEIEISLPKTGPSGGKKVPLEGLLFRAYFQGTSFAFPALQRGRNHLIYSDASDRRGIEVQVDAIPWETTLPSFPPQAVFAPMDQVVPEAILSFSWPKIGGAKGYQMQISAFADMRYPLSPTFERIIDGKEVLMSQDRIVYRLPWRGMLPVNRKLYWRVRPFREDLLAGPWSGIFPFIVKGPQSPEQLKVQYDQGRVTLSWSASPSGTRPQYYEIHSSALEGFVPVAEPHRILGYALSEEAKYAWEDTMATDWPIVPGTLVTNTTDRRLILFDRAKESPPWLGKLGAHLRVIAVDADGSRSCPSPQVHLKSPLIALPDEVTVKAGAISFTVPVISTVGRITAKPPYFLGLWHKPRLQYSLSSAGGKWGIDADLGIIKGHLNPGQEVSLALTVEDQFDNKAVRQIRLRAK